MGPTVEEDMASMLMILDAYVSKNYKLWTTSWCIVVSPRRSGGITVLDGLHLLFFR